jgi:hypothetical protein
VIATQISESIRRTVSRDISQHTATVSETVIALKGRLPHRAYLANSNHQTANALAVMAHEIRTAVAISLNHSQ